MSSLENNTAIQTLSTNPPRDTHIEEILENFS